mmetsp:Transcript_116913/g.342369  ORF Transcript_116913/g.342369 Transcript_116913/m.342369 type:complete len:267 (-) Transcript_116913:180-980(-)
MWPRSSTPAKVPSTSSLSCTRKRTLAPMSTSSSLTCLRKAAKPRSKKSGSSPAKYARRPLRIAATSYTWPVSARRDVAGHTGRSIWARSSSGVFTLTPTPTMTPSKRAPGEGTALARMPPIFLWLTTMSFGHLMPKSSSRPCASRWPTAAPRSASIAATERTFVTFGTFWFTKDVGRSAGKRKKKLMRTLSPREASQRRSRVPRPAVWKSALMAVSLPWSNFSCSRSTKLCVESISSKCLKSTHSGSGASAGGLGPRGWLWLPPMA